MIILICKKGISNLIARSEATWQSREVV